MNNRQQREFWTPVLTEVEGEIAALNAIARRTDDNADVLQITERINSIYQTHLDRLAKQQGREGASLASVAGATTLTVDLPEGGEAKYMSHGKYLVYMAYAQGQAPDWLASDWTDALPGAIIGVASLSYFIAKWPDGYERRYKVQPPQSSRNNLRLRRSGAFWSTR